MSLINRITTCANQHNLLPNNSTIIIGLSGGPDSVFLLHVLHQLAVQQNLQLIAAHVDHQWRPDSAADRQWCQNLCNNLNIEFIATTLTCIPYEPKHRGSDEDYARRKRRYFFQALAEQYNASIALAHHRQDQQETFFIRLIRGSSLSGLVGMRVREGLYIRPLLDINKQDILDYLHTHQLEYRIDSSNESADFLRNRIRAHVLPALHACDERFDQNFFATLKRLQETELFLEKLTLNTLNSLQVAKQKNALNMTEFLVLDKIMQYRVLIAWFKLTAVPFEPSQAFLDEILRFIEFGLQPVHQIHESWSVEKRNGIIKIKQKKEIRTS